MINVELNFGTSVKAAATKLVEHANYSMIGGILGSLISFLVQDHGLMILNLIVIMLIDWFTGILAALRRRESLSSVKMLNGLIKIALYILCILGGIQVNLLLSHLYQLIDKTVLVNFVCSYIAVVELISILENLKSAGLQVPTTGLISKILLPLSGLMSLINDIEHRKLEEKEKKKRGKKK